MGFLTWSSRNIRHLAYAKSQADILIVSITGDKYIDKGTYRPHIPESLGR